MGDQDCSCRIPCADTFRSIVKLQASGINVYVHRKELDTVSGYGDRETFIFHNTSNRDVKKDQFFNDFGTRSSKCCNCNETLKKLRSLLLGLSSFTRNEVVGVCSYCGKKNANTCKKCSYIAKKFVGEKINQYETYKSNIREWLDKVRVLLSDEDKHEKIPALPSASAYQKILQDLERSSKEIMTIPFPLKQAEATAVNKDETKEIKSSLKVIKEISCSEYSLSEREDNKNCMCKIVAQRKHECQSAAVRDLDSSEVKNNLASLREVNKKQTRLINEKNIKNEDEKKYIKNKNDKPLATKTKKSDLNKKKSVQKAGAQEKVDSDEDLLMKMVMENKLKKKPEKQVNEKLKPLPVIDDLPVPKRKPTEIQHLDDSKSDSFVICGPVPEGDDVIHGDSIVKKHSTMQKKRVIVPNNNEKYLLFKSRYECPNYIEPLEPAELLALPTPASSQKSNFELSTRRGPRKYALSDKHFIDVGWTTLPIEKKMRQVNVYKMKPANASDWFIKNRGIEEHFYVTGERFAVISENGSGKWFYRNGNVALEYFGSPDLCDSQRYCIYSSGNEGDSPVAMLAAFDYQGNAFVRGSNGKLRLKYNQNEGVVIDNAIAIPGKWKWHTLNEPIEKKSVFLETSVDSKEFVPKETGHQPPREPDQLMTSIELEGKMKEHRQNAQKALKRFQLKKKVMKLNANFSLHIIDQTNVFLYFRCSTKSIKLSVGMEVVAQVIGKALVDLDDVTTPYDCRFS